MVVNMLMEIMSFRILRICMFVCATEFQNTQLSPVPEPCPDQTPSTTIANMCTTDFANEELNNGGPLTDSVALRVITQQDGCTCEVSLQNQYNTHTIYMRKYSLLTSAAPEQKACGLAIDIDYPSPGILKDNKASIECTEGPNVHSVSLSKNGVLNLRSRVIGGNFARGYCIQIYRLHISDENIGLQINCSRSDFQTTKQNMTVSSNLQTTQHMTDAAIQNKSVSDTDTDYNLYIAIGVGSAVVVIALFVVVAIIINRRKSSQNKNGIEVHPDIDSADDDSDGLNYNALYNASEHQEIMEGNYHIVELEGKQNRTGIQNLGSDYSAVDLNYSSVDIVNMPAKDGSTNDNRIKSSSTTKPRSEPQRIKEETSNNLKLVTAGSNAEYAVVYKSDRIDQNVKHVIAPNDINVEYAVVDKKKCINN